MAKKILALAAEPISGEALKSALGDGAEDAEVVVVAPALDSRMRFWTSDNDEAVARAEQVQEESVERLEEEGVQATGETGESDPLLALQDALATFPAEEIVIFKHAEGAQNWAEEDLVEQARQRFAVPVREMEVGSR
jgi:hypothetical protein